MLALFGLLAAVACANAEDGTDPLSIRDSHGLEVGHRNYMKTAIARRVRNEHLVLFIRALWCY